MSKKLCKEKKNIILILLETYEIKTTADCLHSCERKLFIVSILCVSPYSRNSGKNGRIAYV